MHNAAPELTVTLDGIARSYGRRTVFHDLSTTVSRGQALAVTGPNGSGKSTLMKIVAGLLAPSAGAVRFRAGGVPLEPAARRAALGYVAPDLTLYPELSGVENLQFFARLRGVTLDRDRLVALLERVGLKGRGRDLVAAYSSGMRQRLKYAYALLHEPALLLLDEPTANLDEQGAAMVREVVEAQKQRGLVIIATNETDEAAWGDAVLRLDPPASPGRQSR